MKQMTRLSMMVVPNLHSAIRVYGFDIVIRIRFRTVRNRLPILSHRLADVLLVAFRFCPTALACGYLLLCLIV